MRSRGAVVGGDAASEGLRRRIDAWWRIDDRCAGVWCRQACSGGSGDVIEEGDRVGYPFGVEVIEEIDPGAARVFVVDPILTRD